MKYRLIIAALAVSGLFIVMNNTHSFAALGSAGPSKIGVVSVSKVFRECKRTQEFRQQLSTKRQQLNSQLEALSKEVEAIQAGLNTLKSGSSDYMDRYEEMINKQAKMQAMEEVYKQQLVISEKTLIAQLYKDVLEQAKTVARAKGLDMVFERSEPEIDAMTAKELNDTIGTHKLIYAEGCVDITEEVVKKIDAVN